jgi:hypothetical protein
MIFSMRWFVAQMIKKLDLHLKYDQMVLSRADYIYAATPFHPIAKLGPKEVWILTGEEYGGDI